MKLIGVDIGGTKISAGLVVDGQIVKQYTCPTPFDQEKLVVVDAIAQAISEVFDPEVQGIGLGVPGLVDLENNLVLDVANIPSWDCVPLGELIEKRFNKPAFVNNDANCFAVGEKHFGKGKPFANFIGMTLGTGLGAGIVVDNHLYSGRFSGAGEFGCIYYLDSTIEAYCSGQFFKTKGLDGKEMASKAKAGDPEACKLFFELGNHIGKAISNILFALAPEAIILGGSVAQSYELFKPGLDAVMAEFPFKRLKNALTIAVSDTQNMGILGASSLVLNQL